MPVPAQTKQLISGSLDGYKFGFRTKTKSVYTSPKGLNAKIVEEISARKKEPKWMLDFRLRSLEIFHKKPMPSWGADLGGIDFEKIHYYLQPQDRAKTKWEDVPKEIKDTFDRLGIPEAERKFLGGSGAQFESEVVYHSLQKELQNKGVIFESTDIGLKKYPEIFKEHFGKIIPPHDNKFAALNSAVWSGGSFIYVPKGVHIDLPLQAYFRINAENMGQFERTLIIADEGASVHYVEGCVPAGELISTGDKFINIESVKPKDKVMTETGIHGQVKATMTRRYKGNMLTIHPLSKGNSFQITPEHPVLCIRRKDVLTKRKRRKEHWLEEVDTQKLINHKPEYVAAGKLEKGDFITYVIPSKIIDKEDITETLLKILGLYLAEGSVSFNKALKLNVLSFSFGKADKEKNLAEEVKLCIESIGQKASITRPKNGYYTVVSYSKQLINLCLEHCGKGAATKILSQTIMELPIKKQQIFLDYYLKGDGNIYIKKSNNSKMIRCGTVSKSLAYQIQEIIARQGIFANISTRKDLYIVEYTENKKWSAVRKKDNLFFVPIKDIQEKEYNDFVFNLDVEKINSYLVKGFEARFCL
ncbi:Fe-S cluster assembly protein SufB [Candidatus Peregrinibacteria bacterium]|nr:Fe-S cluster assembly protein SufB [Candidatus Peregrinibacteria bacterium]